MSYDKTNRGTLGKNKNRKTDKHPEYSGQLDVEGDQYWLSAWIKTNKTTGEKFYALEVKRKQTKEDKVKAPPPQDDDDFPF